MTASTAKKKGVLAKVAKVLMGEYEHDIVNINEYGDLFIELNSLCCP